MATALAEAKDSRVGSSVLGSVFKLGEGLEGLSSICPGEHGDALAETPIQEVLGKEEQTARCFRNQLLRPDS